MAPTNFFKPRRSLVIVILAGLGIGGPSPLVWAQSTPPTKADNVTQPPPATKPGPAKPGEDATGLLFAPEEDDEAGVSQPVKSPVGPPAPGTITPPKTTTPATPLTNSQKIHQERIAPKKQTSKHVFGQYRVRIGGAKPTFTKDLKFYDAFYGSPSYYPTISADWYAFDWYATFGVSVRSGFYTDEGKAARGVQGGQTVSKEEVTVDNIEVDKQASTTLTLLPIQLCAIVQFTPFDKKWLVLDGWFGMERLYFQEVRASNQVAMIQTSSTGNDTALTNNGFKGSVLYGFGANLRIDAIDEKSALSMRNMGLSAVYLSPYMEQVQQTDKGANFSRTVFGLAFVFESTL